MSQQEVREIEQPIVEQKTREYEERSQTSPAVPQPLPQHLSYEERGEISGEGSQEKRNFEENISSRKTTSNKELRATDSPAQPRRLRSSTEGTSSTSRRNNRTRTGITRKQFLQWAGWGGSGLIVTLVASQILKKDSEPTSEPITPSKSTDKPTAISVAEPKYIEPTQNGEKFAGLPLWTVEFETVKVNAKGEEINRSTHQAKFFKEDLDNSVILEMVSIPAGEFLMGSPSNEKKRDESEGPQHKVSMPEFFMGRFAVTQAQYQAVIGSNPANFKGEKRPVEQVSWHDATEFCQKLKEKTGRNYRLPSEAEWEYACRAGTTTPFHFGATLTSNLANYDCTSIYQSEPKREYREKTTEVGIFPPNAFGLYDMHGNVWEWCLDHWHDNYNGAPTDGSAWLSDNDNNYRLLRGGSWDNSPRSCRSASRARYNPAQRGHIIGLRVVCSSA